MRLNDEYVRGATDEAEAQIKGMRPDALEIYRFVQVVAQMGDSADTITDQVVVIFTADWSWRRRFALAWRLIVR